MRSAAAFAVPSDPAASKRHGTHFADLARNPADRARQINDETAQPPPPFRVMLRMITSVVDADTGIRAKSFSPPRAWRVDCRVMRRAGQGSENIHLSDV